MGIATVTASYSCEEAKQLKSDESTYATLSSIPRVLVDAQSKKCDLGQQQKAATPEHPAPETTVVVFTNPAATNDDDKVFYGFVTRKDLEEVERTCASQLMGTGAGIALRILGAITGADDASGLASAAYSFSALSCRGLRDATLESDLIVFIGPNAIVSQAKSHKLDSKVLRAVPLTTDANRKAIARIVQPPSVPSSAATDEKKAQATSAKIVVNEMGSLITTPLGKVFVPHPRVKVAAPEN